MRAAPCDASVAKTRSADCHQFCCMVGVIRVVQCREHFVGEELKLEVLVAARRMMNVHLSTGTSSLVLRKICARLCGCYSTKLLEKGQ
jgi:hypothetical protein